MGVLGWSPDEFWNATWDDLTEAISGYLEANTSGDDDETPKPVLDEFEVDHIRHLVDQMPDVVGSTVNGSGPKIG